MATGHRVVFPQYARGREGIGIERGATLRDHALRLGIPVPSACGGNGQCGKCAVRVEAGSESLSDKTQSESRFALHASERLSCQARVLRSDRDVILYLRSSGEYAILTEGKSDEVDLDPAVVRQGREVRSLWDDSAVLGDYEGALLGLAVDIGTSTIVAQAVDLTDGHTVSTAACRNPQAAYGDDVISRIAYADKHDGGLAQLQAAVAESVNSLLRSIDAGTGGGTVAHLYEVVVVGNPTMRNLFFGQSVHSLGTSPYEPESTESVYARASELGLDLCPEARVYGAPLVAGQVGADTLAVVVACNLDKTDTPSMAVDIGTNGEVALGNRRRLLAASNAAGGAFEGGTIGCGVGAVPGAIKNVRIRDGKANCETIGDVPAVGICGSGLIDLLAEMLREGIVDQNGRLAPAHRATNRFGIASCGTQLSISQQEINELRLAKAGSALNQQALMRRYGIHLDGLARVYLAGGFGNYVSLENAVAIGLLPSRPAKLAKVGNGALMGARQMLLSRERRAQAEELATRIEHVRLSDEPDLLDRLVGQLALRPWP